MYRHSIFLLAAAITLSACTATGPADDGFEDGNEDKVGSGVEIYTTEGKGRYNPKPKKPSEASKSSKANKTRDTDEPGVEYDTDAPTDYNAYQRWRQARDVDSAEYEQFRRWQEFEEFLQWKQNQN